MNKDLVSELIEALQALKADGNAQHTPAAVMHVMMDTLKKHRLTAAELSCAYGFREPTRTEFGMLQSMLAEENAEE